MDEIIQAEQPCVVDGVPVIHSAIILGVKAQRGKLGVLPEVQAASNFPIRAARGIGMVLVRL